jgi:crotonobetainyl-CoA:carnitine CoA-transferase CaiB-like acyl-CoA transferase
MQNLHRNKRSLTLNLKAPEGLAIFKRLVANADIVVENYRPDVKARLGIGYEALRAINKRIILASISGFGETGPYRTRAGFDQIAQGMGGLMWVTARAMVRCARARPLPIHPPDFTPRSAFWSRSLSASAPAKASGSQPRCSRRRSP